MSADNETAILESKAKNGESEYRVKNIGGADDLTYEPDYHGFNKESLIYRFKDAPIFNSKDNALAEAKRIEDESIEDMGFGSEYGITSYTLSAEFPT